MLLKYHPELFLRLTVGALLVILTLAFISETFG